MALAVQNQRNHRSIAVQNPYFLKSRLDSESLVPVKMPFATASFIMQHHINVGGLVIHLSLECHGFIISGGIVTMEQFNY